MESLVSQIQFYEQKLKKILNEYNTSMLCEWPAIREKEVYFIRKIAKLKNDSNDKKFKTPIVERKRGVEIKQSDKKELRAKEIIQPKKLI